MKSKLSSLLILLTVMNMAFGADEMQATEEFFLLETPSDCIKFSKKVGELVQSGRFEDGFNLMHSEKYFIRGGDFTISQKNAAFGNLMATLEGIDMFLGSSIHGGFEFIRANKVGDSYITVYFWSKHKYGPVPWRFAFYKPNQTWKFVDFGFGPEAVAEILYMAEQISCRDESTKIGKVIIDKPVADSE